MLEATKETGGCERLFVDLQDVKGRDWSVPLVPKVAQTSLRSLGSVQHEPHHKVLMVVRHPYLRLVSAWRHLTQHEPWLMTWPETWEEFLRELYDHDPHTLDRHLRPQTWFLGEHSPEMCIRLNMLDRVFGRVRENETPKNIPWPEWTQESENMILDYYAEDMAAFKVAIG